MRWLLNTIRLKTMTEWKNGMIQVPVRHTKTVHADETTILPIPPMVHPMTIHVVHLLVLKAVNQVERNPQNQVEVQQEVEVIPQIQQPPMKYLLMILPDIHHMISPQLIQT